MASFKIIPPVIAHRGASSLAPENTMMAFSQAAQLGVKWIEFDVMLSACDTPVIFHDKTLNRTTNARGGLAQYPYSYLQTLDAGSWFHSKFSGERIPTLEQVLIFFKENKLCANIEIKAPIGEEEKLVKQTLAIVQQYFSLHDPSILFSSFSIDALKHLRNYAPSCLLGLLLHKWQIHWQDISMALNCAAIDVNHMIMTRDAAQRIKEMNKVLLCYTVNDPKRAMELYSWGVDAVFSDVPDKILTCLKT